MQALKLCISAASCGSHDYLHNNLRLHFKPRTYSHLFSQNQIESPTKLFLEVAVLWHSNYVPNQRLPPAASRRHVRQIMPNLLQAINERVDHAGQ